jgi:hypothetical protein
LRPLDGQTLEAIAELICGDEGPWYRKGHELADFFRRAGVEVPDHDGSTRKWWTLERLQEINDDPEDLASVVKRLVDPREYRANRTTVEQMIEMVNSILSIEGMQVRLDGIAPIIYEVEPSLSGSAEPLLVPTEPPDFSNLTSDATLKNILENRWLESQKCVDASAYVAAIIMMGSLLEGILLAVSKKHATTATNASAAPVDKRTGKIAPVTTWTLSSLIDVASECAWIDLDAKRFSHELRDFRNMVHPSKQAELDYSPDEGTCRICWEVVRAAVDDLARI